MHDKYIFISENKYDQNAVTNHYSLPLPLHFLWLEQLPLGETQNQFTPIIKYVQHQPQIGILFTNLSISRPLCNCMNNLCGLFNPCLDVHSHSLDMTTTPSMTFFDFLDVLDLN